MCDGLHAIRMLPLLIHKMKRISVWQANSTQAKDHKE